MKLALEALEESLGYVEEEAENAQRLYGNYPTRQARIKGLKDDARKHMDAVTALRQAIAEAEQAQLVTHCEAGPDYCQQCADEAQPVAWMHEMLRVQGCDGTWNCDPYMHGMYNGMEYMLAMVESREPVFRDAPDKWLNTLPPASITSAAYGIKGNA